MTIKDNWQPGDTYTNVDANAVADAILADEADIDALQAKVFPAVSFVEFIGNDVGGGTLTVTNPVPSDILGVEIVRIIHPGQSGASGALSAPGTIAGGGGGGGGAAIVDSRFIPVEALSSTYTVSIPPAAAGGAAKSTVGNGNPGANPTGFTSFTSGTLLVRAWSTNAVPTGGTNAAGGTGGGPGNVGSIVGSAGGAGGNGTTAAGVGGSPVTGSGAGGSGGGGVSAAGVAQNGALGTLNWLNAPTFVNAAGGIVGGAAPGSGDAAVPTLTGGGPGGGAGAVSGAAQDGADASAYGAGGGGGGGSTGTSSGRGGNGGKGYVAIRWIYS
jgi:hypothetical protein